MKLAQALTLRKSNNQQLNNLLNFVKENAYHGDSDPNDLLAKYHTLLEKQRKLISSINHTNTVTMVNGVSLNELRLQRDTFVSAVEGLNSIPRSKKQASGYGANASVEENRIDIVKLTQVMNDFSRQAREIDDLIQMTNWNTDLIEND
jgi:hypothetical protein